MELHPHALVGGVDHREGVAAIAVHVPEAARDAAVGHGDGHLVQRLRQQRPEIPVVVGGKQAGAWIALDGMVQVRTAQRLTAEEDWTAVDYDVTVASIGVELKGDTADVTT